MDVSKLMPGGKAISLIYVQPGGVRGNNKFYYMVQTGPDTWEATYGRVGSAGTVETYPMSRWESKYKEKCKKQYKDVTEHFITEGSGGVVETRLSKDYRADRPEAVKEIARRLQQYANKSIEENYTVTANTVTQKQVDAAQATLDKIATSDYDHKKIREINETLVELYHIIPRKMLVVSDHVLDVNGDKTENENKFREIVKMEQDTLDVMAGQVKTFAAAQKTDDVNEPTVIDIIEAAGLEIVEITKEEVDLIKSKMQNQTGMFKRAFRVINKSTQKGYDKNLSLASNKKEELFWHGSRNENWWSIMTKGLLIRPSGAVYTGSMFGDGIYFAREMDKSLGYTSIDGSRWAGGGKKFAFLALYNVHVGKQYIVDSSNSGLSARKLKEKGGYDSTWAKKGYSLRRDEFIVYNSDQCTIAYLVEVEGRQY